VPADPADAPAAVAALRAFGEKHRGRLNGIPYRDLVGDGRRS